MKKYTIKAVQLKILLFSHNYWRLSESDKVIAELHGLATASSGERLAVGYLPSHRLQAHHIVHDSEFAHQHNYIQDLDDFSLGQNNEETVYNGDDCLKRWAKAVTSVALINQLNLPYPRFGLGCNSNSIYRTFAEIMEIPIYQFQNLIAVGINLTVYPQVKDDLLNLLASSSLSSSQTMIQQLLPNRAQDPAGMEEHKKQGNPNEDNKQLSPNSNLLNFKIPKKESNDNDKPSEDITTNLAPQTKRC